MYGILLGVIFIAAVCIGALFVPIDKYAPSEDLGSERTVYGALTNSFSSEYAAHVNPAQLSPALIQLASFKMHFSRYHDYYSVFPTTREQLIDSGSYVSELAQIVTATTIKEGGVVIAQLNSDFGDNKYIRMAPVLSTSGEITAWDYSSNLDSKRLVGTKIREVESN